MTKKCIHIVLSVFLCSHVFAAYRLWEGKDGNVIEAEFVGETGSSVVLRRRDKSTVRVPKSELCSRDVRYVEINNPPNLKLKLDASNQSRQVACLVSVEKAGYEAYGAPVTLELYVVGYNRLNSDELVLLDSMEWSYDSLPKGKFSDSRKYEREFEPLVSNMYGHPPVQMVEVVGYIIKAFDAKGSSLAMEESKNRLNKEAERALGEALENVEINSTDDNQFCDTLRSDITAARLGFNQRGGYCISLLGSTSKFDFDLIVKKITGINKLDSYGIDDLPVNIDASFSYYDERINLYDQTVYFLGDGKYWKYNNIQLKAKERIGKKIFEGIPEKIDAVAYVPNDGLYIFSALKSYLYDMEKEHIIEVIPFDSSHWPGIPEHIDAAAGFRSNIFFFSNGRYYYFSPHKKCVIDEGNISFAGFSPSFQEPLDKQHKEKIASPEVFVSRGYAPKIPIKQIAPTMEKILVDLAASQKGLKKLNGELAVKLTMPGGKSWIGNVVGVDGKWIEFTSVKSTKPIRVGVNAVKRLDFKIWLDVKKIRGFIDQQQHDALCTYLKGVLAPFLSYKEAQSNLNEIISFVESLEATLE